VVTIQLDDTLREAARVMADRRVGSLIVINAKDEPCGIVTDRDLVVYGFGPDDGDPAGTLVNDVMAVGMFTVAPDAAVDEVIDRMREEGVRRVPVVDDGDLVGIATLDDLLAFLVDELSGLVEVIRAESPAPEE